MIPAGNACRALRSGPFSRITEAWRMAMQAARCLLALAGLIGLVGLPPSAVAQARAGVPRIGILFFGAAPVGASPDTDKGYQQGLRELGYVEGQNIQVPELHLKRLQLLKQAFPEIVRVAMLVHPVEAAGAVEFARRTDADTRRLGLQLQLIEVTGPADFDAAFSRARQQRAQAICAVATNTMVGHASTLAAMAAAQRLLSISDFPLLAQAGFVMTYGADVDDLQRRSMIHVDKILKGAKAGDLPIERPTKFQLTVNAGAAKAMGITIPPSLLLRADEVIQ